MKAAGQELTGTANRLLYGMETPPGCNSGDSGHSLPQDRPHIAMDLQARTTTAVAPKDISHVNEDKHVRRAVDIF